MKKILLSVLASSLLCSSVYAADLPPLQSDTEPDRTDWSQLESKYGPLPAADKSLKIGGVSKTLTNEYWRSLGEGYKNVAGRYGFTVAYWYRLRRTLTCRLRWKARRKRISRSLT